MAFCGGSLLATFCQGVILGAFIRGIPIANEAFSGGSADFASAFAGICGLGLIAGYTLLGATWLIFKSTGTTAAHGRAAARFALPAMLAFIAIVSIWTPIAYPEIARRWFSWPNIGYLWPVPLVTAIVAYAIWRSIPGSVEWRPFLLSIALFLLAYLGLGISLWPYAVPYAATLWQAASSPPTLIFVGIGTAVILPIVLGYFAFAHWVFRGKITAGSGYDH
jgi:cytochrome d ubiquinol oxidase subunit II